MTADDRGWVRDFDLRPEIMENFGGVFRSELWCSDRGICALDRIFDDVFAFFGFEGASGVNEVAAGGELVQARPEDSGLSGLEIRQIGRFKAPLDFGIARKRTGAGTGDIGQDTLERSGAGVGGGIGGLDFDVCGADALAEEAGTLLVEFEGDDLRTRVALGEDRGFSSGGGTAVEDAVAVTSQEGDQLRGFVLDPDFAASKR